MNDLQNNTKSGFSIIGIVAIAAFLVICSAIVYLFVTQPAQNSSTQSKDSTESKKSTSASPNPVCTEGDKNATNGTFCSEDIGISVQIPEFFKGKIIKTSNYDIYSQDSISEQPKKFGTSELTYQAYTQSAHENYSLIIAIEPLRNFRVRSYVPALFNMETKQLTYDPQLQGPSIETVTLADIKFFEYGVGDAGVLSRTYLGIKNNKLLVISLVTNQRPDVSNYIIDSSKLINEFETHMQSLKVV
jgi:hypothetical protein